MGRISKENQNGGVGKGEAHRLRGFLISALPVFVMKGRPKGHKPRDGLLNVHSVVHSRVCLLYSPNRLRSCSF